jgi:anti-sigma regulatory factor (Ser/Thr protein kinase)
MSSAHSLAIKADLDNLGRVRDFIEASVEATGLTQECAGELLLAVDEAVSNIIMHGFAASTDGNIEVEVAQQPDALLVHIRDNAPLFDPTMGSNPHLEISPLERDAPGGFGVYLLNHLVDKIAYRVTDDGRNELTMLKKNGPKIRR